MVAPSTRITDSPSPFQQNRMALPRVLSESLIFIIQISYSRHNHQPSKSGPTEPRTRFPRTDVNQKVHILATVLGKHLIYQQPLGFTKISHLLS
jgi:hypothetical protein